MDSITRLSFDADIHEFSATSPTIPEPVGAGGRRRFRTIWISDVHLGTRGCAADLLIDFLDSTDSETMYLVGDIIDGWRLKKKFYWPDTHNDIVWRIMKRAKRGTRVVYVPGNHDEMFRQYAGLNFGGVEIKRQAIHETADGRKLLVAHGDEFDAIVLGHRWIAFFGDQLYSSLMRINRGVSWVRARFGHPARRGAWHRQIDLAHSGGGGLGPQGSARRLYLGRRSRGAGASQGGPPRPFGQPGGTRGRNACR